MDADAPRAAVDLAPRDHTDGDRVVDRPPRGAGPARLPIDLIVGASVGVMAIVLYAVHGFDTTMLLLLVSSVACLSVSFASRRPRGQRIDRRDLMVAFGLMVLLSPLYLIAVHSAPVQVNSDEVAIMSVAKSVATAKHVDPFGLSDYFGDPTMVFLVFGKLGRLLGGIDLYHMRLLHGLFGLAEVGIAFALFRQLLSRLWALFAATILGVSHAFFMLSRLAMRDNTPVLIEVAALALLVRGLRRDDPLLTFFGGLVAGFGFYTYFPGRIVIVLWLAFLGLLGLRYRARFPIRKLIAVGGIAVLGCAVIAGPVVIATIKAPPSDQHIEKVALLIFPEGRKLQQQWVGASSVTAGIEKNVLYGLTAFNNTHEDHGWIYINPHHGFVDPLTGGLLWVGVAVVVVGLFRRRDDPWPLLMVGIFLFFWLLFAFVVNKAPDYTRLLVTLPLVAYLVACATKAIVEGAAGSLRTRQRSSPLVGSVCVGAVLVAVLGWNLTIGRDYIRLGQRTGDDIGSTVRYVESHRAITGERFYLAADTKHPYFVFGLDDLGTGRLAFFAPGQVAPAVASTALPQFQATAPFSLFVSRSLWTEAERQVVAHYPQGHVANVTPDGRLLVFEVGPAGPRAG